METPNDSKVNVIYKSNTDWGGVAFVICVFLLIVLCAGEPDLLDAIIKRVAAI